MNKNNTITVKGSTTITNKKGYVRPNCSICEKQHFAKGYCVNHYTLFRKYGYIPDRTRSDGNKYVLYEDYAEIIIYDKNNNERARSTIDIEDIQKAQEYKWCLNSNGYVKCNTGEATVLIHRIIMSPDEGMTVDHIDRDKLNNRKSNLRVCTYQENNRNIGMQKNNKSGFIGVCFTENMNKWKSYINVDNKLINIGFFSNIEEAIKARLLYEKEIFGEFSPQKHLFEKYGVT